MARSEQIFKFSKRIDLMSKCFISYNFIKLLEHILHAQNTVRLRELRPIFEVLCVIHREHAGGKVGGGAVERGWVLDESQMISQNLHLIVWCWEAASAIGPHHSQEIL